MVSLFTVTSCDPARSADKGYFSLDSLLDAQIGMLLHHRASLNKTTVLGASKVPVELTPDDEQEWRDELDIFRDLGVINRFKSSNAYLIEDGVQDDRSNLKIRSATIRKGMDESVQDGLKVRYLKIFYEESYRNIRRLEARYAESNSMYENDRYLTMIFEDVYNMPLLTAYAVRGGQKIVMGDTVDYMIEARILYTKDRNGKENAN